MVLASKEVFSVALLCCIWYVVSSGSNVVGKTLLNQFPYPMTVTMVQLLSIAVYSGPFFNLWGVRRFVDISWPYYFKLIVPLALGKFVGSVFTHVSLWKVPVSYTHTVKATMPLFSVVLSRIILGEKQCLKVYLSLVPIIAGVAIASFTEISFDVIGLMSALAATLQHTLQNIFSKKVLHDTGIHHLRLLHILGRLALMMFLPVWLYFDFWHLVTVSNFKMNNESYKVIGLLFTDGILSWLQNILAFSVMSMVTSLTYAVASSSKRIFVVAASLFVIGNPVTINNVCGMALALFGVIAYNKAKYDARRTDQKRVILPMTYQHTNNSTLWQNGNINSSYINGNKSLFV
ncbi:solute carrier family 35 member E1 homolog [Rhopalosiphum maidis]|uniref:solute carrier family 35 member E1 homolog n=1 Tax=Rhopalosiphum maidis TaxID=43146 RepID=UPI000EFFCD72|nr:solute carrier family 35 member E1 homolog [Rhopalosiphum maidis]